MWRRGSKGGKYRRGSGGNGGEKAEEEKEEGEERIGEEEWDRRKSYNLRTDGAELSRQLVAHLQNQVFS